MIRSDIQTHWCWICIWNAWCIMG